MQKQHRETSSGGLGTSLLSLAVGAGAMYLLDPGQGGRRQAQMRDKVFSGLKGAGQELRKSSRYTANRMRGLAAKTASRFSSDDPSDQVLAERVRSALGRAVSHPRALRVEARDGVILLAGPIVHTEAQHLVNVVNAVRGVRAIENHLELHRADEHIPSLQGGRRRRRMRQDAYSPPVRMALGAAGAYFAIRGFARGDLTGMTLGMFGTTIFLRAATNIPTERLIGTGTGRYAVEVQKTLNIRAPREDVFDFFASYENFPRFMSNVRKVTGYADDTSHWVVRGPMGVDIEWDAVLTAYRPGELIAWKTLEGQRVGNAGRLMFTENDDGSTKVEIRLSYNPVAGVLGHVIAKLFGSDPKSEMDQDLMQVKTMLETGVPPRAAAAPFRPEQGAPLF